MVGAFIKIRVTLLLPVFLLVSIISSCNPFAPRYDENGLDAAQLLGDPSSVDGFFKLFKNAYELRDTSLYGRLFSSDFQFTYYDFENGQPISWDRATEMNTAYNLFRGVEKITLDWNYYTEKDTTETEAHLIRNFNLSIVQDGTNTFIGLGRAQLRLRRNTPTDAWKAYYWFDDSEF